MTKEKNNAPVTTNSNLPAEALKGDWGAIEDMETSDLLVPKIFHQQAMSKLVAAGTARPGDFCDSLSGEVLAKKDDKLEVIIFGSFKQMVITKFDPFKKGYALEKIVTIQPENAKEWAMKPLSEETDEGMFKYNMQYNYYCLIPGRMDQLPYVLSLGSTKTKAAKKLNTIFYNMNQKKKPSAAIVFEVRSVEESNDRGKWFGVDIAQGRASTEEELFRAHAWYLKSKSQKFVVVEEETAEAVESREEEEDTPY